MKRHIQRKVTTNMLEREVRDRIMKRDIRDKNWDALNGNTHGDCGWTNYSPLCLGQLSHSDVADHCGRSTLGHRGVLPH